MLCLKRKSSSNFAAMKQKMHIICLRSVRYSDSKSILSAYSLEAGRVSLLVGSGKGREAMRRRALTQPLGVLECVADVVPGRDIHRVAEMRPLHPLSALRANPVKCGVAMFLAEVLGVILGESQADEPMWRFVSAAVVRLDALEPDKVANFHVYFLYRLGMVAGIAPDSATFAPGKVFDLSDGRFRTAAPLHRDFLYSDEAEVAATLSRMTFDNMHLFRFTRAQRNRVTDLILRYFTIHYARLDSIKSLEVLRSL